MAGQQHTGGQYLGLDGPDIDETFSSDVINLDDFDLVNLDLIPNSVLRAAIQRVRVELDADDETTAYFQSSLPHRPGADRAHVAEQTDTDN
jgi:FXSXX-COOH protein